MRLCASKMNDAMCRIVYIYYTPRSHKVFFIVYVNIKNEHANIYIYVCVCGGGIWKMGCKYARACVHM